MAKLRHCGIESKASSHRLVSSKQAYRYQILYHCPKCKTCGLEFMQWKGEYPEFSDSGNPIYTSMVDIPKDEMDDWRRRVDAGEAKKPQMISEYTMRSNRPADIAMYYQKTIEIAQRFCKVQRLES